MRRSPICRAWTGRSLSFKDPDSPFDVDGCPLAVHTSFAPAQFDGGAPTHCRIAGPSIVLNAMTDRTWFRHSVAVAERSAVVDPRELGHVSRRAPGGCGIRNRRGVDCDARGARCCSARCTGRRSARRRRSNCSGDNQRTNSGFVGRIKGISPQACRAWSRDRTPLNGDRGCSARFGFKRPSGAFRLAAPRWLRNERADCV